MLTLEEFRATRKRINDLAPYFGIDPDGCAPMPGYTYAEDCYLVIRGGGRTERTYLGILGQEWTTSDLAAQEERLYRNWYMLDYVSSQSGEGAQS